jgi:5-(carboxyamino)imidazole ribonucleotide synthase
MSTIGIVGGGQLGRMLTLAAVPLGFQVVVLDPTPNCPAAQVGAKQIEGSLRSKQALQELGKRADYITFEIEHLDTSALEAIGNKPIRPSLKTVRLIQDKFGQKEFLQKNGVKIARFKKTDTIEQAKKELANFGQIFLKTRHDAYDGRGNFSVKNIPQLEEAWKQLAGRRLYVEETIDFASELSIIVARDIRGSIKTYPLTETVHQRSICLETLTPARVEDTVRQRAEKLAVKTAETLEGAGVFGIEMFLDKNGEVLINEIAPRVHNSGHYTIETCSTSQFEQHIRAITGLPLGHTGLTSPSAVMINILGERNGSTHIKGLDKALRHPQTSVHLYGKSPTKIDRKMGHITATGKTLVQARRRARSARKEITI